MLWIFLVFLTVDTTAVVHQYRTTHGPAASPTPTVGRTATESWDQENLKKNDHGCPTAIFIAPNGELEQCE